MASMDFFKDTGFNADAFTLGGRANVAPNPCNMSCDVGCAASCVPGEDAHSSGYNSVANAAR